MALHYRDARLWKSRHDAQRASVLVECARAETARRRDGAAGGRAAVRRRRAAASAGAAVSPALALAQQTVGAAAFTCGGCGTWLFRANDMVDDTRRECDVALTDSVATVCVRKANVTVGEMRVYERQSSEAWEFSKGSVTCSHCGLFLGVKIESGTRVAAAEMRAEHTFADFAGGRREGCEIVPSENSSLVGADATAASFEVEHGPAESFEVEAAPATEGSAALASRPEDLEPPRRRRLGGMRKLRSAASSAAAAVRGLQQKLRERKADWEGGERAEPRSPRRAVGGTLLSAERVTFEVDQFYFGLRYLRMQEPRTGGAKVEEVSLCCRGCDSVLSHTDQVLCTERRWGFRGVTNPEPSVYINSLLPGSTKVTPVSRMALGQGVFDMCDVTCAACERRVGYRFLGAADSCNENHVGRAGLVLSCVQLGAERQLGASGSGSAVRKLNQRRSHTRGRVVPRTAPSSVLTHEGYRLSVPLDPHA